MNIAREKVVYRLKKIIAFVFDVNYKYSFKLIKDKIIDNKFNLLKANIKDDRIEKLELFVKQYIEEMIVC